LPKIGEDGNSWLRRPKFYKRVVEPNKKKNPDDNVRFHESSLVEVIH
jgi:hypothetical protein